jgi:hypothetical protein
VHIDLLLFISGEEITKLIKKRMVSTYEIVMGSERCPFTKIYSVVVFKENSVFCIVDTV